MALIYHNSSTTIREDLLGTIAIMSPNDLPLLNMLDRRMVSNTTFENIMDDIPSPTTTTTDAKRTDFDWSGSTTQGITDEQATRQRFQNYIMYNNQGVRVTDDHRHDDEAGFEDEYTYQQRKEGLRLLKRVENNLRWAKGVAGGTTTPYVTAGILQFLAQTGRARTAGASATTISGVSIDDAYFAFWFDQADAALVQSELDDVLQGAYINGLDINNTMLFCGPKIKRVISSFASVYTAGSGAGLSRWNQQASERTIHNVVDFYESDLGEIAICLDRYMIDEGKTLTITEGITGTTVDNATLDADQTFFLIDPDYWRVAIKQPFEFTPTAKTGSVSSGYWSIGYGVECRNTKAGAGASGVGSA